MIISAVVDIVGVIKSADIFGVLVSRGRNFIVVGLLPVVVSGSHRVAAMSAT